jgi:hypothetical protein
MNLAFPLRFDARGRTAEVDDERHVRDLIEQLLFTLPGERVNRPTFGAGLAALLFAPNGPELASAAQLAVQGALQSWLGEWIQVEAVEAASRDGRLEVTVCYLVRRTQERRSAEFVRGPG